MRVTGKDAVRHDGKYATSINMGLAGKECTLRGIWRVCIKDFSTFAPLKPHILLGLQWLSWCVDDPRYFFPKYDRQYSIKISQYYVSIKCVLHQQNFEITVPNILTQAMRFSPCRAICDETKMKGHGNMFIDIHITSLFDLQVLLRTLFQKPQIQLW